MTSDIGAVLNATADHLDRTRINAIYSLSVAAGGDPAVRRAALDAFAGSAGATLAYYDSRYRVGQIVAKLREVAQAVTA